MQQTVNSHDLDSESGVGARIAIVCSRFNSQITDSLVSGAKRALFQFGVDENNVSIEYVPGAFELPFAANTFLSQKKYDAIICIGAVIRGETPHFDYVAGETSRGIMDLNLRSKVPVIFGVLTCDNLKQAETRSQDDDSNKGYESGVAALEMVDFLNS